MNNHPQHIDSDLSEACSSFLQNVRPGRVASCCLETGGPGFKPQPGHAASHIKTSSELSQDV